MLLWHGLLTVPRIRPKASEVQETFGQAEWHGQETVPQQAETVPQQALNEERILVAATLTLNERAMRLADYAASNGAALRVQTHTTTAGARLIDCGIKTPGGLQAGLALARVCLAGQAEVSIVPGDVAGIACPSVVVSSDFPVL